MELPDVERLPDETDRMIAFADKITGGAFSDDEEVVPDSFYRTPTNQEFEIGVWQNVEPEKREKKLKKKKAKKQVIVMSGAQSVSSSSTEVGIQKNCASPDTHGYLKYQFFKESINRSLGFQDTFYGVSFDIVSFMDQQTMDSLKNYLFEALNKWEEVIVEAKEYSRVMWSKNPVLAIQNEVLLKRISRLPKKFPDLLKFLYVKGPFSSHIHESLRFAREYARAIETSKKRMIICQSTYDEKRLVINYYIKYFMLQAGLEYVKKYANEFRQKEVEHMNSRSDELFKWKYLQELTDSNEISKLSPEYKPPNNGQPVAVDNVYT